MRRSAPWRAPHAGAALALAMLAAATAPPAQAASRWLAPASLSESGPNAAEPRLAVDPSGDAIAVWACCAGGEELIQAAQKPASGSWQTPVDLSGAGLDVEASEPHVAVDSHGDAVAVWRRFDGFFSFVQAAVRPAGGSWQRPVDLSEDEHEAGEPQVAVDSRGDAVAVWEIEREEAQYLVRAARRPAGGSWQRPVDVSEAGRAPAAAPGAPPLPPDVQASQPQVAIDSRGHAVAVWERAAGRSHVVRAATERAGGSWQRPVDLSAAGRSAGDPQVAADPRGEFVAVWDSRRRRRRTVMAAVRPVGRSWRRPVAVSRPPRRAGGASEQARNPQVALDSYGDAVAAWTLGSRKRSRQVVQTATRLSGGAWRKPLTISEGQSVAMRPQVSVAPRGDAVAVWETSAGLVQGAVKSAAGPWQPSVTLSSSAASGRARAPQAALDAAGNAVAVWELAGRSGAAVQAAVRSAQAPSEAGAPELERRHVRVDRGTGSIMVAFGLPAAGHAILRAKLTGRASLGRPSRPRRRHRRHRRRGALARTASVLYGRRATLGVDAAGVYRLEAKPSRRARAALRRGRTLRVRLTLAFVSTEGGDRGTDTVTVRVRLRRHAGRGRRGRR